MKYLRFKIGQKKDGVSLVLDPLYMGLCKDDQERQKNYQEWIRESIPSQELDLIRKTVNKNGVFGNSQFKEKLEKLLGRRFDIRNRGRPRKE